MNYLTNYYKNLSEQLQEKVTILESYLHKMNEDLEPGTIVQGYGASNTSTTTNQNDAPGLNSLLQAWGSSDPTYDYNGDGVVDGNDLGIYLSRMVGGNGGSTPTTMASTAMRGTPGAGTPETPSEPTGTPKKMKALDQAATAKTPFAGTYNAGAGSQIPRDVVGKNPKETSSKKGLGADLTQVTNVGYSSAPKPKTPTKTTPEMTIATMLNKKGTMAPTSNVNNGQPKTPPTNYTPQKPKSPTQVGYGDENTNVIVSKNTKQTPSVSSGNIQIKAGTNPPTNPPSNTLNYNVNGDQLGLINDDDLFDLQSFIQQGINQDDPDWNDFYSAFDYNGNGVLDQGDYNILYAMIYPPQGTNQMNTTSAGLQNVEFRGKSSQRRKK